MVLMYQSSCHAVRLPRPGRSGLSFVSESYSTRFRRVPALLAPTYAETGLWQAQVKPPPGSREALPAKVDVAIVGAGLCGLAAADTLAVAGRSVVVFDREPLCWGASSRNGGMVIPELKAGPASLEQHYGEVGQRMYAEANDAFDFIEATIAGDDGRGGIECNYQRSGQLYLAHTRSHVGELRKQAAEHAALGEPVRFVPASRLTEEIGSEAFFGGVVFERTGGLHPARFHAALASRAMTAGAQVIDRTGVTGLSQRGVSHRVETTRGTVQAADVIVATNAYADGATPALKRKVLPVGSYIIATEVLPEALAHSVSPTGRMMVDTKNFLFYWRLTPDRRLAFGGRRSLDPVDVPEARDFLYDAMLRIHPQLAGTAVEYAWGGNVAITLDRLPHVGRLDGAWYATGCNGSGVAMNTWLGHRLGEVLTDQAPPPALAELKHRNVPLSSWRHAYLPLVSRWFDVQDRR